MTGLLLAIVAVGPPAAHGEFSSLRSHSLTSDRLAVGFSHTCAIGGDGTVRCWGRENFGGSGYLGYPGTSSVSTPSAVGPVDLGTGRRAAKIAIGYIHSCAILDNGSVRCWGSGAEGLPGYGNTNTIGDNETPGSVGPVDLGAGRTAVAITAGSHHTCALLDTGSVLCWGFNQAGQLGYGNTNPVGDNETPGSVGPVDLGAGRTAVAIDAGAERTCAVLDNGSAKCWGGGSTETPASMAAIDFGTHAVVGLTVGTRHTCAVLDDRTVRCWGSNSDGELGYGDTDPVASPAGAETVNIGAGRTAVAVEAAGDTFWGGIHTCVLLDDGTVRCWGGSNGTGQLGTGNTAAVLVPGSVPPIDLGAGREAVQIAVGVLHTCALLDDSTIRCWGSGAFEALGNGSEDNVGDDETPGSRPAVELGTEHGVLETTAGGSHTCALFDTGTVRCWGSGASGQLGYGATANVGDDENVGSAGSVDLGGHSAKQIRAGGSHTCALLDNGTVHCWGLNASGQLGYGNTTTIGDTETPGSAGPVSLGRTALSISAGSSHNCAVLSDSTVRCWGLNASGQLGYGNTTTIGDTETPGSVGPVSLGGLAVGVSAGGSHSCAVLTDGTSRCWGNGANGRLGYASTATIGDDEAPSTTGTISLSRNALSLLAGGEHSCAMADNGTVRCWGAAANGQLGYGNTTPIGDNELPSSVGTLNLGAGRNAQELSGGDSHNCALLDNRTVRCWGNGANGRLGYASTDTIGDTETPGSVGPVDLGTDLNARDVSAGASHSCAALANGQVRCWGLNGSGQLGYGNTTTIGDDETPGSVGPVDFVDDPPTAVDDSVTVNEDVATALDVLANDTDPDGGPKPITAKTNGANGTVTITGGGTGLTYLSDANYCGADSFTYTLNESSTATVSVTVTCVDDAPVALNDSATIAEDSAATAIGVLANDTDVDGGPKAVESKTNGLHGTATITGGGGLTYTPEANYCGPDSFTYTLNGGSSATVSVTIGCVDDAPVAVNDSTTVAEDSGANAIGVLANDTDIDGGAKEVASKTNGTHGAVAITGGGTGLTYLPEANYCGPDSFTYTLNGGSSATVSVTIGCVDDAPVAVNDSTTVAEDSGANAIDVLANDTDIDGGAKEVASKANGANGTVTITGGGSGLTYTPDADYCGPDTFSYGLAPGGSTATVSVTVTCDNDSPIAVNDSTTVAEDSGANAIDVLANDTDVDGGPKAVESKADGLHGTATITGGGTGLAYTPAADYCGPDSFTYTLNGGSSATVSITVSCIDDAPVAVNDSDNLEEDAGATAIDVLANDTDVDGGLKSIAGRTNGAHGSVAIIGAGAGLTYAPGADYCGPDAFTYTLNGGSTATVSIAVSCVDEPAPPQQPAAQAPSQAPTQGGTVQSSSGAVVSITPGVGVVSGRRRPRVAVKGIYVFFTLTCKLTDRDCAGIVKITINVPSVALGATMRNVRVIKGRFRIGSRRSVLVRAKLTRAGLEVLEKKRSLRGVSAHMAIVDTGNGERGRIQVNLVRRPKASLLPKPRSRRR